MALPQTKRMTAPQFAATKGTGRRLAVLTCYDYLTARLFDEQGVDALLVGDSLGTVVQGRATTLAVTMEAMVYHVEMVSRAAAKSLVIADLPFMSYQVSTAEAIRNAGRLLQEGGAQAVKLEGGRRSVAAIGAIVQADIPVMGHVGLTPQSIHHFGRYKVQRDAQALLDDARAVEDAGAFAMVIETVPADISRRITESVSIPTIGIGAGPHCDGQVLVWQDAFGLTPEFHARFVKRFANLHDALVEGVRRYCQEVREGTYPDADHSYE